jgi:hypothetical protein
VTLDAMGRLPESPGILLVQIAQIKKRHRYLEIRRGGDKLEGKF